ncbi:hypothetical protein [Oricola thermophila]|uniref:Tail tape measure protein n=1 Tax=Oricola thermophila TaxID=2742145 RepID=A0A6N1VCX2_9HYPH|nr:hypothetical protein [Oricola thermophila]QKV18714.1 hypothetical protein HTY61_09760 [Oricola thermophila]
MSDLDYSVGLDGSAFKRGADQISRRSRQLRGDLRADFSAAGNSMIGFARTLGVALPLSFGAAATGMASLVRKVADSVAELQRQAETAGVSFEGFQELKYVAEQNLIGVDALTDGLKEMQLRADEFIKTTAGPAAEAFSRIGFSIEELEEELRRPEHLFETIIERVRTLDKAAQIRVLDEIFGGTAAEQFQRLMDEASGSISRLRQDARELGIVLDEDYLQTVEDINRQWNTMSSVVGNFVRRAVIDLTNDVIGLLDRFREIENISSSSLETRATEVARQRLEIENKILALKDEQRNVTGVLAGAERKMLQGKINSLQAEFDRLGAIEQQIMAEQQRRREIDRTPPVTFTPSDPPPPPGKETDAEKAAERQRKAIADLIAELDFEREQLGRTAAEQEVYNRLKSVGVDIDSEAGQAIAMRVRALEEERAAIEAAKQAEKDRIEAAEYGFGLLADGLDAVFDKSQNAEDALRKLAVQLAVTAAQGALLGTGPLAGLFNGAFSFGGGGDGFVDGGISAMLGYQYHTGGIAGSGGAGRSVSPAIFASAPRYHTGGIAGLAPGEVPAILKRGEVIDPGDGSMFGRLTGGGQVSVILKLSDDLDARIEERAGAVADVRIERYDEGAVERTAENLVEAQVRSLI